jgi:hypothetical protein
MVGPRGSLGSARDVQGTRTRRHQALELSRHGTLESRWMA